MAENPNAHVGQQEPSEFDREIGWKAVGMFMIIIAVVTVGAFGSMWFLGVGFRDQMARSDSPAPLVQESRDDLLPPEPRLQTTSYDDWSEMEALHEDHLSSYAWVDRDGDVVRIPVEEAMRRVVDEGLPTFPAPAQTAPSGESAGPRPVEDN